MSSTIYRVGPVRGLITACALLAALLFAGLAAMQVARADTHDIVNASDVDELIAAIDAANGPIAPPTTIVLNEDGVYELTEGYLESSSGLPSITGDITIEGNGATIERDPDSEDDFRIFHVTSTGNLTLNDLTVSGGNVSGFDSSGDGGGIFNEGGTVTLEESVITGNNATSGGGIASTFEGFIELTDSTISDNHAMIGGGMLNMEESTATFLRSTVSGNTIEGGILFSWGAGILNLSDSTVYLTDSEVSVNVADSTGGGIVNFSGAVTLTDSLVSNNKADFGGGGIYNYASMTVTGTTITGNEGSSGGGISNFDDGTMTLTDSIVSDNESDTNGGGLYNSGTMTLTNTSISDNESGNFGGGISNDGELTLTNSTVTGNTTPLMDITPYRGGGIYNSGELTVNGSLITGNDSLRGGGIYNFDHGVATINNSTISENLAIDGGGIWNGVLFSYQGETFYGTVNLTNSTISDNEAFVGGGVHNGGVMSLVNVTVSRNEVDEIPPEVGGPMGHGGGIFSLHKLTSTNSTVSGNAAATSGGGLYIFAGETVISNSVIAGNEATTNPDIRGTPSSQSNSFTSGDPELGPLQMNGGATLTMAPLPGSPLIDVIDEEDCEVDFDQRGVPRPQGERCDIGAVEVTDVLILEIDAPETAIVGTEAIVTVTLLSNDQPVTFAEGWIVTLSGHNGDETITLTDQGTGATTVTSTEAGPMELAATHGALSGTATITWELPTPFAIEVSADPAEQAVGQPATIIAEVTDQLGDPVADGIEVTFNVTSEGSPTLVDPFVDWTVETEDGEAEIVYTNMAIGIDSVTASVDGVHADNITDATVNWTVGDPAAIAVTVTVPASAEQTVGFPVEVQATVRDQAGNVVSGRDLEVVFVVSGPNAETSPQQESSTGVAFWSYTGLRSGEDTVTAAVEGFAIESENIIPATVDWLQPEISFEETSYSTTAGENVTLTAYVTDGEDPVGDGVEIRFAVEGDDSGSADPTTGVTTTENGQVSFAYINTAAGQDTVRAFFDADQSGDYTDGNATDTATVTIDPADLHSIVVSVDPDEKTVGQPVTATATVTDEFGNDVQDGTEVTFSVDRDGTANPTNGDSWTVQTTSGQASIAYTNILSGTDTVSAAAGDASDLTTASVTWLPDQPDSIVVSVDLDEQTVGEPVTISAEVTDEFGNPVADGTEVTFASSRAGTASPVNGDSWTVSTSGGVATLAYTNTRTGTDSVTASAGVASETLTDAVTWLPAAPENIDLRLSNNEQTIFFVVVATATITDQYGNRVADGHQVDFAVDRSDSVTLAVGYAWSSTTVGGQARFAYTNTQSGTDTVTASVNGLSDTASVRWLPSDSPPPSGPPEAPDPPEPPEGPGPPAELSLSIEPEQPTVGETVTILVLVLDADGNPVGDGIEVSFQITPEDEENSNLAQFLTLLFETVETADGEAAFSYTRDEPGTDMVVVTVEDLEVSGSIEWIAETGDPVDPPAFACVDGFGNEHFAQTWARTDLPVRDLHTSRTWMWGPCAFAHSLSESYADSPDGERAVAYFDKARMEINDPGADPASLWYVTNGLLVVELITGERQFGDDLFASYGAAEVNVAGDPDDPESPTYASFGHLLAEPPQPEGALLTQRLDRDGTVTEDQAYAGHGIEVAYVDEVTGQGIAASFWTFMTSHGLVYEDGSLVEAALFENPFYATGRPISRAYWATVAVDGEQRDVLMQCFERRCLTYTPGNPEGFVVEAGNVGQHYYTWRYVQAPE